MHRIACVLTCLLCSNFTAHAKIGETEPQLIQRFGSGYSQDTGADGIKYKFRSATINVDVVVENGVSISETYLSNRPLNTAGEPPNDVVQGILRTNVPKAKWVQIDAAPFAANYALKSSDSRYIATLKYSGKQDDSFVWAVTVQKVKSTGESVTASTPPTKSASPDASPSSSPDLTAPANWDYSEQEDEMGRGSEKFARVESLNTVNFGFPYEGDQHATLLLRKSPKYGNDAVLRVQRDQFTSSLTKNFVTVRFDKGELQKFVVGDAEDGSGDVLFIRHYDQFVRQLRKAKTVRIEADFYREGSRVFEFDVHGLRGNW